MELKDIMTLLKAGYTKADIDAMITPAVNEQPAPAEETPAEAENKPAEQPKAAPMADNTGEVFNALSAEIKALNAEVKNLRTQLQSDALKTDGAKMSTPEDEAVRILANIINPPAKTKK